MNDFTTTDLALLIQEYLTYCEVQKRLDEKTLKAYRIDLRQFREQLHPHHGNIYACCCSEAAGDPGGEASTEGFSGVDQPSSTQNLFNEKVPF